MILKQCFRCKHTKNISEFSKRSKSSDGLNYICRQCSQKYYKDNKEEVRQYNIQYNKDHKEEISQYDRDNRKRHKQNMENWYISNPKYMSNYRKNKYKNDINFKLAVTVRRSIYGLLKNKKVGRHWENLVGWKLEEGIKYIESQFTLGMSWSNYGYYVDKNGVKKLGWEIDHIDPISNYDITDYNCADFKKCWALSNLRPMWATTRVIGGIEYLGNRNKYNRIIV